MRDINRRNLLTGTTALVGLSVLAVPAQANVPAGRDPFDYEITRSEAEWREMLGEDFGILREGKTELPRSSPLWAEARQGTYDCRGCDLLQYDSSTKVNLLKGWVFFASSEPNAQLMSQDTPAVMSDGPPPSIFDATIEVHCRRCGSHMGHILLVEGTILHCINGASLTFTDATT
jgi:peptide-methionine (R)-S-oxide reductase